MGLRHMYVMPSRPRVVGLLTRKDIIQERTSLTLGLYARGLARPPTRTVSRTSEPPHDARDAALASSAATITPSAAVDDDDDAKLPYIPYYSNNPTSADDHDDASASARASRSPDLDAARASNPFIDAASTLRRR